LSEFAKKLEPYEDGGEYAEHCVRTYFAIGDILNFCERVEKEYQLPGMAQGILETMSLSEINATVGIDRELNRTGHDIRNLMELSSIPEAQAIALWKQAVSNSATDIEWQRELFEEVHKLCHVT
jgi:hypothetical protein